MSLPSGYIDALGLPLTFNGHLDTGIKPSGDLEVEYLFSDSGSSTSGYLFGARNTQSNTAAGQYGLLYGGSGATSYFALNNARTSIGNNVRSGGGRNCVGHFYSLNNSMQLLTPNTFTTGTGTSGSFTGTRNIWFGCLNNANTASNEYRHALHGLKIKQGGTLVRDYYPAYDTANNVLGVYDVVNSSFSTTTANPDNQYFCTLTVSNGTHGKAYIRTLRGDKAQQMYMPVKGSAPFYHNMYFGGTTKTIVIAEADDGYEFLNWTDGNGNIVSTEAEMEYQIASDTTLTPNFQKITEIVENMRYRLNVYGYGASYGNPASVNVVSASIKTDTMQKVTSEIYVEDVPSVLGVGAIVSMYSPRGKRVYIGVVNAIEDKKLTCREALSVYDQDYLFTSAAISNPQTNLIYGIYNLMNMGQAYSNFISGTMDSLLARKFTDIAIEDPREMMRATRVLAFDHNKNPNFTIPAIAQTETKNFEDYILGLFDDFGIYFDLFEGTKKLTFVSFYYKLDDAIAVSNNSEAVSDVQITDESQEANTLMVYNAAGTTLRGIYGVKTDGTIGEVVSPYTDFVGYTNYKAKVVTTDDNILNVLSQNLSNSGLNHKVTFNVRFGGMFNVDDFYVGRPINFYVGDRLFQSVITSVSFSILENREDVLEANITIGKVRTNLTSKINLGKVK